MSVQRLIVDYHTHRRRPDFANASFLGDWTDLIDESIWISKFFPAGLEDRALRRRLELVRPRQAHRFGPTRWWLGEDRSPDVFFKSIAVFCFFLKTKQNPVCSPSDSVAVSRHQHERRLLTHTHIHTLTLSHTHTVRTYTHKHTLAHTHPCTVRRMFQGSEHVRSKN